MSWPSLLLEAGSFRFGKINVVLPLVKRVLVFFFVRSLQSLSSSGPPSSLCPFWLASVHSASLCLRSSFCSLSSLACLCLASMSRIASNLVVGDRSNYDHKSPVPRSKLDFFRSDHVSYFLREAPCRWCAQNRMPPPPSRWLRRCNYFYRVAKALRYASAAYGVFELLICKRISKVEKKTRLKRISG